MVTGIAAGILLAAVMARGQTQAKPAPSAESAAQTQLPEGRPEVPAPPFSDGIFPCSDCHKQMKPNTTRRKLEMHDDIVLKHDEKNRWCLDCHSADNRDMLHLASGDLVPFSESYRLCGQCHGEKYRDWRAGVHGRRIGEWQASGHKQYLLCVNCHSPHSPRFKPLQPKPMPIRPTHPVQ